MNRSPVEFQAPPPDLCREPPSLAGRTLIRAPEDWLSAACGKSGIYSLSAELDVTLATREREI